MSSSIIDRSFEGMEFSREIISKARSSLLERRNGYNASDKIRGGGRGEERELNYANSPSRPFRRPEILDDNVSHHSAV